MNEIERFLDQVCCGVGGSPDLRRHLRKELREHLTEEIERNLAAGLSQEEAVRKAIAEFGDPVLIRDGLQAVHGRRLMSLLIEKSMTWRETTMKTGWKWSFVAQAALAITIVAEMYFAAAAVIYVLPGLWGRHADLGTPTFAYLDTIRWLGDWMYMQFGWTLCLLLVLAGWGLFEWRYRGENRSIIRLTSLSLASLLMFLVLAVVWVPMVIDLFILPGQIHDLQLDLTVLGDSVTLKGERQEEDLPDGERFYRRERPVGSFARTVTLPEAINPDSVKAEYKNGVLKVRMEKAEQAKAKKITIKS